MKQTKKARKKHSTKQDEAKTRKMSGVGVGVPRELAGKPFRRTPWAFSDKLLSLAGAFTDAPPRRGARTRSFPKLNQNAGVVGVRRTCSSLEHAVQWYTAIAEWWFDGRKVIRDPSPAVKMIPTLISINLSPKTPVEKPCAATKVIPHYFQAVCPQYHRWKTPLLLQKLFRTISK